MRAIRLLSARFLAHFFRTITLKLRYNDFQDVTRSISLEEPADMEQDVYPLLPALWRRRAFKRAAAEQEPRS